MNVDVLVRMRSRARVCVRACVRASVSACVYVCVYDMHLGICFSECSCT